jgi:hypothetical protein
MNISDPKHCSFQTRKKSIEPERLPTEKLAQVLAGFRLAVDRAMSLPDWELAAIIQVASAQFEAVSSSALIRKIAGPILGLAARMSSHFKEPAVGVIPHRDFNAHAAAMLLCRSFRDVVGNVVGKPASSVSD